MANNSIQDDLFLLLGYLLTSAHGLYGEPQSYGPFRLMDAAGRLTGILRAHGMNDLFLEELEQAIDEQRFGTGSDDQLRERLAELCLRYTDQLKLRLGESST